jgi:predicted GNAT superfamily acetyltransferase
MPTDRFVVAWPVDPSLGANALGAIPEHTPVVVAEDAMEHPFVDAPAVAVRVPRDISALAAVDIILARRWRMATRRAFTHYLARDYRVMGFVADGDGGRYLLSKATD